MDWRRRSLVIAITLMVLVAMVLPSSPASATAAPALLRPDCPSECGGVQVPYPFGIWENCSLPSFDVTCYNNTPYLNGRYLLDSISVTQAKAQILKETNRLCNSPNLPYWLELDNSLFSVSPDDNDFIVLGCDVIAILRGNFTGGTYSAGCIATCSGPEIEKLHVDGNCTGIGCCQTSIRFSLNAYYTSVKKIQGANISDITRDGRFCARPFIAKKGNYTFRKKDLDFEENIVRFPIVLDWAWAIGNRSCEEASKDPTSYACKSRNSECLESATGGVGYICNCSRGYQGNPYLQDGCQDIDECEDRSIYPCNGTCQNIPGSYNCVCPFGTIGNATINACYPDPSNAKQRVTIGIIVGISSSLGLLLVIGCISLFWWRLRKNRRERSLLKHFQRNHDMLLQQQSLLYSHEGENIADKVKFFSLKDMEKATNNFDKTHVVGHGGHGTVYKGLIDLRVVAIKKSKVSVEDEIMQFLNEIILLSQISHRNVVKVS